MILFDFIHLILNAAAKAPIACGTVPFGGTNHPLCPGAAFTAISAAYGTQGIWVMADLLDQLIYSPLNAIGPLLYVIAAAGALTSLALGAPPKLYLWFFLGPALFRWLLGTQVPAIGMSWQVAGVNQDQAEVWRLAEVGLVNTAMAWKGVRDPDTGVRGGAGSIQFFNDEQPSEYVWVPYFYAIYDNLISGTIQGLINWTGIYSQRPAQTPEQSKTSLPSAADMESDVTTTDNKWFLLSNSKWGMIENITGAKIHDPYLRTALVQFLSSECGDMFAQALNPSRFLSALYGRGRTAPSSVFSHGNVDATGDFGTLGESPNVSFEWGQTPGSDYLDQENYSTPFTLLSTKVVPMPRALKSLIKENSKGSFRYSVDWGNSFVNPGEDPGPDFHSFSNTQDIRCSNFLNTIIAGFRWEAGQIYHQFLSAAPASIDRRHLAYNLLYGWDIRKWNAAGVNNHLTSEEQEMFIQDLILVHLIRNEMALTPPKVQQVQMSTQTTENSATGHLRYVASKNKFSELYQWALMIPHMQGILLYYLTIAYPFACLLIIIPGMHKTVFTWMSFWAWVRLWDLGFAMVMALERSVWAMLGSNSSIMKVFGMIANMQKWGYVNVKDCEVGNSCAFVDVYNAVILNGTTETFFRIGNPAHWDPQMRIFDRALSVGANLDLDIQNSYYIYIMAGLYFAVPVVTGQMVLGAKSGMAGMVNNVIGGVGQEAGRQAASGYQGDLQTRIKTNFAVGTQQAQQTALRSGAAGELMAHALESGNQQVALGAMSAYNNRLAAGQKTAAEFSTLHAQAADRMMAPVKSAFHSNRDAFSGGTPIAGGGSTPAGGTTAGGTTPGAGGSTAAAAATAGGGGGASRSPLQWAKNAANNYLGGPAGLSKMANVGVDSVSAMNWQNGYAADAQSRMADFQLGNRSYGQQQASSGYQLAGDRARSAAGYETEMAAWDYKNAFAQSLSATAASLGGLAGGVEPGQMPGDNTGMAMSGEAGHKLQDLAGFSDPWKQGGGAYQGLLKANNNNLRSIEGSLGQKVGDVSFNIGAGWANPLPTTGDGKKTMEEWGGKPDYATMLPSNPANQRH